jgi:GNAT superfamily N-acetyltransferase
MARILGSRRIPDTGSIKFAYATRLQLRQVIEIQNSLHVDNLHSDNANDQVVRWRNGFVSLRTTYSQLKAIRCNPGVIVAFKENGEVIAYRFALTIPFVKKEMPFFDPLFKQMEILEYEGKRLVEYRCIIDGQVGVLPDYQNRGIGPQLHQYMLQTLAGKNRYDLIVAEIARGNHHSRHVGVEKFGYAELEKGQDWIIYAQKIPCVADDATLPAP